MAMQSFQLNPDQKRMVAWYLDDDVATGTEQSGTVKLDAASTALAVSLHVKTAPVGAALIVDINEGGTSLFSTRPQINDGSTTGGGSAAFSDTALAAGAEISMDVDQVGSSTAGADLTVCLEMEVA